MFQLGLRKAGESKQGGFCKCTLSRDFFLWHFGGTVFSFVSFNCMQISSSSSAVSKISRAVFGVRYMDTVECSILLSV